MTDFKPFILDSILNEMNALQRGNKTRSPAIAEGPRDAGVPVEIW